MPATWASIARRLSQRPTRTSTITRASAPQAASRRRLRASDLTEEPAVPGNRDLAVGFGNDILARAAAHLLEVVLAVVRCADHFGDTVGPARRYDDAAADAPDDGRSLAVGIGRDDDGPAGGENPVEPAGDDVSRESAGKTDVMDMRCRDRLRQRLARLVAEKVHAIGLQHLGERLDVLEPRTRADDDDREILQIAKERRGADENVE